MSRSNMPAGTDIYAEVSGTGEPVFFLNGVMMTVASWALQRRALEPHFRCVFHDFRGQLRSAPAPPGLAMSRHVEDLAALMDSLGVDSAHLVGTSYGGEVGMMFAGAYPQRVRSLSVIASVAHVDEVTRDQVREWARVAVEEPYGLADLSIPQNYSAAFLADNPAFVEAARQRMRSMPPEWFTSLALLCEAFLALDIDPSLVSCPTLVICGEDDTLKPVRFSREIAAAIPGARLEVIDGAGHAVVIERADRVNELLLEFLKAAR